VDVPSLTAPARRVRPAAALLLAGLGFALAFGAVEWGLRRFVDDLPGGLSDYVASGYNTYPSGIYRFDPTMKMSFMRPHYEREMYWNGYRWHHRTDALGFRNPADRAAADVVLLGDSMVYGHGVEETSTIRHHLEEKLRRPVANLGIQGAGIHEEYQVFKRFGVALRPRYAFLFFLVNDIYDTTCTLTDRDMERFLATAVDDHDTPYFDAGPAPKIRWRDYLREFYVVKAIDFLVHSLLPRPAAAAETWESEPLFERKPRYRLAMRFHLHALLKMQNLASRNGIDLVNVFIPTGGFRDEEPLYRRILESFCREHGIRFYDLGDGFARAPIRHSRMILPHDGHFSDAGSDVVADLLAAYVERGDFDAAFPARPPRRHRGRSRMSR
jgi:hypothetical protein